jgi:hypothetical protein
MPQPTLCLNIVLLVLVLVLLMYIKQLQHIQDMTL